MTTPSEEAIRAACAEAGIPHYDWLDLPEHTPARLLVIALARRIEAGGALNPPIVRNADRHL